MENTRERGSPSFSYWSQKTAQTYLSSNCDITVENKGVSKRFLQRIYGKLKVIPPLKIKHSHSLSNIYISSNLLSVLGLGSKTI